MPRRCWPSSPDVAATRHAALELRPPPLRFVDPGAVLILQDQPSTGFSLTGTLGSARVAWRTDSGLPIVQCVKVRRAGNAISGLRVELLAITPRIKSDADCPGAILRGPSLGCLSPCAGSLARSPSLR